MKIAVSGKGGVGKSTIAAALALTIANSGGKVMALDADPDANLASALGITTEDQKKIVPISKQIALIEERTGAKVDTYGKVFKLNPEVSDVAEKYSYRRGNIDLLVLGAIVAGGGGCACPESTFIRSLVTDLVMFKDETLIMDMEAGIEHLGRATSKGVDMMVVVVEPGKRSIDCAFTVQRMANEIGVKKLVAVANKVTSEEDAQFIKDNLPGIEVIATIPYSEVIRNADREGISVLDVLDDDLKVVFEKMFKQIEGRIE
ncbi:MAG: AAA family ATPase [Clostridiales bacterium]|nr:AAA family ATPase [Clostridiales bacterium]